MLIRTHKVILRIISVIIVMVLISSNLFAATISNTVTGFFNLDNLVDTIHYTYSPQDDSNGIAPNYADIRISLGDNDGTQKQMVKRYEISEGNLIVRPGEVGEILFFESGSIGSSMKLTNYYSYNTMRNDWYLIKTIEKYPRVGYAPASYEVTYFPGNSGIDGETIDKETTEVEVYQDRLVRMYEKLISMHSNLMSSYKRKQLNSVPASICDDEAIAELVYVIPVSKETVEMYNNIGFFMGYIEGAEYCSIYILSNVIQNDPGRTPAYLNLADVYYNVGQVNEASELYKKYLKLMQNGKTKKIPKRVVDRVKQGEGAEE